MNRCPLGKPWTAQSVKCQVTEGLANSATKHCLLSDNLFNGLSFVKIIFPGSCLNMDQKAELQRVRITSLTVNQ